MLKFIALILTITAIAYSACSATADDDLEISISGSVISKAGKPAGGAIVSLCRHSQELSKGKQVSADADGHFEIKVSESPKVVETMHLECKSPDGAEIGFKSLRSIDAKIDWGAIELRLDATKKAKILVIDTNDKPIEGANACARLGDLLGRVVSAKTNQSGIAELVYTDSEPVAVALAWKDDLGFDFRLFQPAQQGFGTAFSSQKTERFKLDGVSATKLKFVDDSNRPLKGIKVYPLILRKSVGTSVRATDLNLSFILRFIQEQSDENGEVSFRWLPSWQKGGFTFNSFGGEDLVHSPIYVETEDAKEQAAYKVQLQRTVPIRGRVVNADGKPMKGITISATGEGTNGASKAIVSQTDEAGNYEVRVAPNQIIMMIVKDEKWASTPQQGFAVLPNTPVEGKNFTLRKATRIYGKVRGGFWLSDVPNHRVVFAQLGKSLKELPDIHLPEPAAPRKLLPGSRPSDTFETWTDENGNFELSVGDGNFVRISDGGGEEFQISGEAQYEMNFKATAKTPARVTTDKNVPLLGLIVENGSSQPVRDCLVTVVPRAPGPDAENVRPSWEAATDAEGKFRAERIRIGSFVHAISSDKKMAAIMEIKNNKNVFVMKLQTVGSAKGRLLSADGSPLANQKLGSFFIVPLQGKDELAVGNTPFGTPSFVSDCTTDSGGHFHFKHLVPNIEYHVFKGPSLNVLAPLFTVTVKEGEELDLGDLKKP